MHQLIREHREHRKVPLNVEHRLMSQMGPHQQHDKLTLIQKVWILLLLLLLIFWIFGFLDFWIFGFLDFWILLFMSDSN